MSGGAFNYAYFKISDELDTLASTTVPEILEWMKTHQVNPDAIRVVQDFAGRAAGLADFASKISALLHAIEWQASGDSQKIDEELKKLFEKYPMMSNQQFPG